MSNQQTLSILPKEFNQRAVVFYLIAFALLSVCGAGYLLWKGKYILLGLIAAAPVLILLASFPRLAVGQFIFSLFISRWLIDGEPWLFADVSGFILLVAALLDVFSESKLPESLPRLTFNFVFLLIVVFTAAIFSYQPWAAINPLGRISLMFLYFLALYR
ncbi:MAG: hypothetical protein ACREBV_00375, partial [Candidatus Zixiibacteriota bacterium]